jgi:hypothetical protein
LGSEALLDGIPFPLEASVELLPCELATLLEVVGLASDHPVEGFEDCTLLGRCGRLGHHLLLGGSLPPGGNVANT